MAQKKIGFSNFLGSFFPIFHIFWHFWPGKVGWNRFLASRSIDPRLPGSNGPILALFWPFFRWKIEQQKIAKIPSKLDWRACGRALATRPRKIDGADHQTPRHFNIIAYGWILGDEWRFFGTDFFLLETLNKKTCTLEARNIIIVALDFGFRIWDVGFWIFDLGFLDLGIWGFGILGFGDFGHWDLGFLDFGFGIWAYGIWDSGFGILGFRILGFGIWGLGFRIWDWGSQKASKELQEGFLEAPTVAKRGARHSGPPAAQRARAVGKGREGVNPSPEVGDWV